MNIDIKERALSKARELFPTVAIDELIVCASKIEAYLLISDQLESLPLFMANCFTQHPIKGAIPFQVHDYQTAALDIIQKNDRVIIQSGRQLGTTSMLSASALWDALRQPNRKIFMVDRTYAMTQEHRRRIEFMHHHLLGIYPKILMNNKQAIEFDNGSSIHFAVASNTCGRGHTISSLYIDSMGFISHSPMEEFWTNIQPCLSTGRTKVVLATSGASAPKGIFYDLWTGNNNGFAKVKINWQAHPDRDQSWATQMINMMGHHRFVEEYESEFKTP
jgi:hypothetical protein